MYKEMYKEMYKDGSIGSDKYFCQKCDSEIINHKCPKCEENILENFEWTDKSVIDFVNWFLDLHKLPFRYKLENMEILESFMRGDDFSVWHYRK